MAFEQWTPEPGTPTDIVAAFEFWFDAVEDTANGEIDPDCLIDLVCFPQYIEGSIR